jgi:hypothetical protein
VKKEMERAVEKCLQDSAEDGDGSPIVTEECQARVLDFFLRLCGLQKAALAGH